MSFLKSIAERDLATGIVTSHHQHNHCRHCHQGSGPSPSLSGPHWPGRSRILAVGNAAFLDLELTWRGRRHSHHCPQAANQRPPGTQANLGCRSDKASLQRPAGLPSLGNYRSLSRLPPRIAGGKFHQEKNCQGESRHQGKQCPSSGSLRGQLE